MLELCLLLVRLLVLIPRLLLLILLLCSVDLSRPARPARKRRAGVLRRKAASIQSTDGATPNLRYRGFVASQLRSRQLLLRRPPGRCLRVYN